MLKRPDERTTRVLAKLAEPEFEPFIELLTRSNGEDVAAMMHIADDVLLRQYQGRTQAIHELLSLIKQSSTIKPMPKG